jgi:hypothetical protein
MSTYLTRIIEVKNESTHQWEHLVWWSDYSKGYQFEEKNKELIEGTDIKLTRHDYFCNNACVYREILKESDLANRDVPSDASEYTIEDVKKEKEKKYSYGFTFVTLNELSNLLDKKFNELFKGLMEEHDEKIMKDILERLDIIEKKLDGEKPKKRKKHKEDEDENYEMEEYYKTDFLSECLSISDEISAVDSLIDEIYGFIPFEDVRIIYYFT